MLKIDIIEIVKTLEKIKIFIFNFKKRFFILCYYAVDYIKCLCNFLFVFVRWFEFGPLDFSKSIIY